MDLNKLIESQIEEWDLAGNNFRALALTLTREVEIENDTLRIQFNPGRIQSSTAKVDTKSIAERPCFLCGKNRPLEQKGIPWKGGLDYLILVNPFPIFKQHFTIPTVQHIPQRISGKVEDLLNLAADMQGYAVFYNGPKSGASAPDHFHFQAGNADFLPLLSEYPDPSRMDLYQTIHDTSIYISRRESFRRIAVLKGRSVPQLVKVFGNIYQRMREIGVEEDEPMLNLIAYKVGDELVLYVLPRKLHRPKEYFSEKEDKLLVSPGAVDMAGVFIMSREEDYYKITADSIKGIIKQVSVDNEYWDRLFPQ